MTEAAPARSGVPLWGVLASVATVLGVVLVVGTMLLDVGERMSNAQHVSDGLALLTITVAKTHADDTTAENEWRAGEDHKWQVLSDKMDDMRHELDTGAARGAYDRAQHR